MLFLIYRFCLVFVVCCYINCIFGGTIFPEFSVFFLKIQVQLQENDLRPKDHPKRLPLGFLADPRILLARSYSLGVTTQDGPPKREVRLFKLGPDGDRESTFRQVRAGAFAFNAVHFGEEATDGLLASVRGEQLQKFRGGASVRISEGQHEFELCEFVCDAL